MENFRVTVNQIKHLLGSVGNGHQHKSDEQAEMAEGLGDLYLKIESAKQRLDEMHETPDEFDAGPTSITSLSGVSDERRPPLHRKMSLAEQGRLDTVTRWSFSWLTFFTIRHSRVQTAVGAPRSGKRCVGDSRPI